MRITSKYVLFWQGIFSNFYNCRIVCMGREFKSSEQLFMYLKADLFHDEQMKLNILNSKSPKEAKYFGRKVRNFDSNKWDEKKYQIMQLIIKYKFEQNEELKKELQKPKYKNKIFVEASPYDKIWGIGLHYNDILCDDERNWKGENLLGKVITQYKKSIS